MWIAHVHRAQLVVVALRVAAAAAVDRAVLNVLPALAGSIATAVARRAVRARRILLLGVADSIVLPAGVGRPAAPANVVRGAACAVLALVARAAAEAGLMHTS